jgi:hypothetical protein
MGITGKTRGRVIHTGTMEFTNDPRGTGMTEVAVTNAQALAFRATPISLVPAPGPGKALVFERCVVSFDRTAAYTESTANMVVKYTNGSGVVASDVGEATGFADAAADAVITFGPAASPLITPNAALVLHNNGAGEWGGGNAANVLRVKTFYRVVSTDL